MEVIEKVGFYCMSASWDPEETREDFPSVREFLDVCEAKWGRAPQLQELKPGHWYEVNEGDFVSYALRPLVLLEHKTTVVLP